MPGFHLRATGNRWKEGIVVIAVVVLVVMKWVDEWPADITLGPEQNIYSRRPQRSENGGRRKEGKRKLTSELEHPIRWPRINPPLVAHPWSEFLVSLFLSSLLSPIFTRGPRLQPQSPAPQDYRLSRVAGYIPTTTFPVEFQRVFLSLFLAISVFFLPRDERDHIVLRSEILSEQHRNLRVTLKKLETVMW